MIFQCKENRMNKYDTIFLDRDGTLNPDSGYINSLDQFRFYDFTIPALKKMSEYCAGFCIITNQSGVSRGLINPLDLDKIHDYVKNQFIQNSIPLLEIYIAIDHPDNATDMRKPGDGMFLKASRDHLIELHNSLMIGDSISDIQAGKNLGMDTILVLTGRGTKTLKEYPNINPNAVVKDLSEAADWILG